MTREQLEDWIPRLAAIEPEQRVALPGITPERTMQIVGGGIVADEIMRSLNVHEVEICPWALREGAILRWLDQFGRTRLGSDRCGFCAQRLAAAPVTGQLLLQLCQLRANLMQFGVNLVALGGVLGTLMITRQLLFGGFQRDDLVPAGDSRVQIGSVRGIENRLRAQRIPTGRPSSSRRRRRSLPVVPA